MTGKRTARPAATFTTRSGATVVVGAPAPASGPEDLPERHVAALLAAYRIATYEPRSREAWRQALDALELEPEARAVAAEYLQDRWASTPYSPDDFKPGPRYGDGVPVRLVFCREA